jgi:hypothetical protein
MKMAAALLFKGHARIRVAMKLTTLLLCGALVSLVGCQSAQEKRIQGHRETLQRLMLFERTDVSGNELISLAEFKAAYTATGRKSVEELFAQFDLNGNGVLSKNEWLAIK